MEGGKKNKRAKSKKRTLGGRRALACLQLFFFISVSRGLFSALLSCSCHSSNLNCLFGINSARSYYCLTFPPLPPLSFTPRSPTGLLDGHSHFVCQRAGALLLCQGGLMTVEKENVVGEGERAFVIPFFLPLLLFFVCPANGDDGHPMGHLVAI